jgi:hypothetical protein
LAVLDLSPAAALRATGDGPSRRVLASAAGEAGRLVQRYRSVVLFPKVR